MELTGRNAHERFDEAGLKQIHSNCYDSQEEAVRSFTYFRMNDKIFRVENWNNFVPFVRRMSTDLLNNILPLEQYNVLVLLFNGCFGVKI